MARSKPRSAQVDELGHDGQAGHGREGDARPAQLGQGPVAAPQGATQQDGQAGRIDATRTGSRTRTGAPARRPRDWSWRARYAARCGARCHLSVLGPCRRPGRRLYCRLDIQSAYSLCIQVEVLPLSTTRAARDSPVSARSRSLVTELPGPKARAHVSYDETWTSPSLPRAYPIVPVRGEGLVVEDIDGNLFLDFAAGIAVNSTGHCAPAGRGGHQGAGRRAHPLLAPATSTCPSTPRSASAWPSSRRSPAGRGPIWATPGRRSSRRPSSSPATRPIGRTWWPSWARSTGAPTAPCR